jgi:hypothetical protein
MVGTLSVVPISWRMEDDIADQEFDSVVFVNAV